jgi:peptide/nickel transport system permease protein
MTPLLRFLIRRLLSTFGVLFIVVVIVFLLLRLTLESPAALMAGDSASDEEIRQIEAEWGLNRSPIVQFGVWFNELLHGNLGESYFYNKASVADMIAKHLEPTIALAVCTILMAVLIAVPLGVLAAWRHGGWLDRGLMVFSTVGFSVPVFVLGYVLVWLVSLKLKWLPVLGYVSPSEGFFPFIQHIVLPSTTLSLVYTALIARVTRAAVSEALTEDYVRTARAKGLSEMLVLLRHALANAAMPIVTVIGLGLATLLGGVVVTEHVFAFSGIGDLTVDAVFHRDFLVIQGVILLFSLTYVVLNLLIDLSYILFDPRIRY